MFYCNLSNRAIECLSHNGAMKIFPFCVYPRQVSSIFIFCVYQDLLLCLKNVQDSIVIFFFKEKSYDFYFFTQVFSVNWDITSIKSAQSLSIYLYTSYFDSRIYYIIFIFLLQKYILFNLQSCANYIQMVWNSAALFKWLSKTL